MAASTAAGSGGSGACPRKARQDGASPLARTWRQSSSRGVRCSSGTANSSITASCVWREKSRKHTPGATRPARPMRCLAEARQHQVVTSARPPPRPRLASCTSLTRPQSMT